MSKANAKNQPAKGPGKEHTAALIDRRFIPGEGYRLPRWKYAKSLWFITPEEFDQVIDGKLSSDDVDELVSDRVERYREEQQW